MKLFDKMKEIESKAAPIEKWIGTANIPFYGYLQKPRPSLSKHEGSEHSERMLHYDDLMFILAARRNMPKLLQALDIAMEALNHFNYDCIMGWETESQCDPKCSNCLVKRSIKQIEVLNEDS